MPLVAEIVELGDLFSVVWTALVAGIGVCIIFSMAIIGYARAVDTRRDGNPLATAAYLGLMGVAIVAVLVVVVFGVVVMTSK